ncbi:MAG TPA: transposase, partial [Nitrospirae bacterium]|nr:transposase [Nitrospirota bacterium]
MKVFSIAKGFHRLWKNAPPELTKEEIDRIRAVTIFRETRNIALVCETFGISRATQYRWLKRFDPGDFTSIKHGSRRPRRLRKPQWSYELLMAVKQIREQYPRWGKDKLFVLLKVQGWQTSVSTVGRIVTYLKKRGELIEPQRMAISAKRKTKRPYAVRKPKDYKAKKPGDLVQVDTLDIRPLPGIILKQFTARDVVSRWDVVETRTRATSKTAKEFTGTLKKRMPFKIKAIQVDGGSEFYADFEDACKAENIKLFVLPPKSPKLNGFVERANRTHTEEFYEIHDCSWTI